MINNMYINQWHLPGQRIIKTSAAVTLCLLFYSLIGFHGSTMPAEAAITAIICMQPYVHGTTESGLNRLWGTVVGAVWGFLFLLSMLLFPAAAGNYYVLYLLMGLGTLITLHSTKLLKHSADSCLAAIVFICVVIAFPDIENPMKQAFLRILDVLFGSTVAFLVNGIHLPRAKNYKKVLFIPMSQLTDNQFSEFSPQVLFRLKYLLQKGAKICLISQHAPSFRTSQFGDVKYTVPMIVMDGAAIFDPNENEYIATTNLNPTSCRWLMKNLDDQNYFIYTVHRNRNCIYHHGELTELEEKVYRNLKRSPYRYYLDDDHFPVSDVVYIKLVTTPENAQRVQHKLEPTLKKMKLRSVIRSQAGIEDGCSLYFYASNADVEHAREHLMYLLWQKDPELDPCEITCDDTAPHHHSETQAVRLLRKADQEFEPLLITKIV